MKVITTHLHADFDCLGSMVAARKLYPDAVLIFPGSQEKNVREYLARVGLDIPYRKLHGFDIDSVKQLIVVDACTKDRIGPFSKLADKDDVEIHLYDHHVTAKSVMNNRLAVIRERGATVTIFVEILRENGVAISSSEATVMMMGLYEDTGSLTFSSVTREDYTAASWLLSQGADLNVVSNYIKHELNGPQVEMLDMLIKSMEYHQVAGLRFALATGSTDRYIGDLSPWPTS